MTEVTVTRRRNHLGIDSTEFVLTITKGDDFGRTNESEIQRIPKEYYPFAFVIGQGNVLELDRKEMDEGWEDSNKKNR